MGDRFKPESVIGMNQNMQLPRDELNILLFTRSDTIALLEFTHTIPRRPKNIKNANKFHCYFNCFLCTSFLVEWQL